jgi:ribonuclease HI
MATATPSMFITVFVHGYKDPLYNVGGWSTIICNNTLKETTELFGNDTEITDRRMIQVSIAESLEAIFSKYGGNNLIDLISPTKYIQNAIGDWRAGSPGRRVGWMHAWAKKDWHKANNTSLRNAHLWERIYNTVCKQHTVRVIKSELIKNSVYLDRCVYLAQCSVAKNTPTPFNYTINPNIFDIINKNPNDEIHKLINTRIGWLALIRGLRKLSASLSIDCLNERDLIELAQTEEMIKLRLKEKNL